MGAARPHIFLAWLEALMLKRKHMAEAKGGEADADSMQDEEHDLKHIITEGAEAELEHWIGQLNNMGL